MKDASTRGGYRPPSYVLMSHLPRPKRACLCKSMSKMYAVGRARSLLGWHRIFHCAFKGVQSPVERFPRGTSCCHSRPSPCFNGILHICVVTAVAERKWVESQLSSIEPGLRIVKVLARLTCCFFFVCAYSRTRRRRARARAHICATRAEWELAWATGPSHCYRLRKTTKELCAH